VDESLTVFDAARILVLLPPSPLESALQISPERATTKQPVPEREFFCFRLSGLRFGVPSENVREVFRVGPLTPLPRTPAFVLGVCGHRGEVLPVIDFLRLLGKGEARVSDRSRLFIGFVGTFVTAILADSVIGMKKIPLAEILPPPLGSDAAAEHLIGVANPSKKNEAINLLDFSRLIHFARQRAVVR
jgi:purine-binding chemotaxis protein CheW